MIGEGVHSISLLKVPGNSHFEGFRMACIVRGPGIWAEVVPVYPRKPEIARYSGAEESKFLECPALISEAVVSHRWILMVSKGVVDGVDLFLQNIENLNCLCRLTCIAGSEGVIGVQKAGGLFFVAGAIANRFIGAVEITRETIDLTVGNSQLIFQREGVVFARHGASIGKSQSNSVSQVAVLGILEAS